MEATITLRQPCRMHFGKRCVSKAKPVPACERTAPDRPHAAPLDNGWSFYRVRVPW